MTVSSDFDSDKKRWGMSTTLVKYDINPVKLNAKENMADFHKFRC